MINKFSQTELDYIKELVFGYDNEEVVYTNIDDLVKKYKEAQDAENSGRE